MTIGKSCWLHCHSHDINCLLFCYSFHAPIFTKADNLFVHFSNCLNSFVGQACTPLVQDHKLEISNQCSTNQSRRMSFTLVTRLCYWFQMLIMDSQFLAHRQFGWDSSATHQTGWQNLKQLFHINMMKRI